MKELEKMGRNAKFELPIISKGWRQLHRILKRPIVRNKKVLMDFLMVSVGEIPKKWFKPYCPLTPLLHNEKVKNIR